MIEDVCIFSVSADEFIFVKQKSEYEVRMSDWNSYVCSSDLDGFIFSRKASMLGVIRQRALPSVMRAREACEARTENARGTARPVPGRPRLDSTVPGFARACLVPGTGLDQYRCRRCPGRGLAGGRGGARAQIGRAHV